MFNYHFNVVLELFWVMRYIIVNNVGFYFMMIPICSFKLSWASGFMKTILKWNFKFCLSGYRSCWYRPKDKDGRGAWRPSYALCPWSKWKSCNPEVYWMCSWRGNSIHHLIFFWSSCHAFHPPIWLPRHTGWRPFNFKIVKRNTEVRLILWFFPCNREC